MFDISPREIVLTDNILGKGAFGEVRIAFWRNIAVAYKRPHINVCTDGEDCQITEEALQQEIQVLSQLRHPNLVLFIGTCRDLQTSKLSIVTELLPTSLYDMLEVSKIDLTLPDILDIAMDVISGLEYLHGHDPVIVHRDISAKNILIGGNRAKIADLGQAKIFSNVSNLSRQSKLPGAMAYAAPETLTGKYFSPIDVFSFGVLLCQMCTREYPRIDRREEQIRGAMDKYSLFQEMIEGCVNYQPQLRPTASTLARQLLIWKENDRHYPISRRQSPEKDVGILALHWMHRQIDEQTSTLRVSLHQQTQLLEREEQRWRSEAGRVDNLQHELDQARDIITILRSELNASREDNSTLQKQLGGHLAIEEDLKGQLKVLSAEQEKLLKKLNAMEGKMAADAVEFQQVKNKAQQLQSLNQQLESTIHTFHTKQEQLTQRETLVHRQLEMQVDYARDVEERLEQTLVRWREEHEQRQRLEQDVAKLNRKCSDFLTRESKLREEKDMIERRLSRYEGLPVPEEIKARFQDLKVDNDLLRNIIASMEQQREQAAEQYQSALQELIQADVKKQHLQEEISMKEQIIHQREQTLQQIKQRHADELANQQQEHVEQEHEWRDTNIHLKEDIVSWANKCKTLEEELAKSIALTKHFQRQLLPSMHSLDELVAAAASLTKSESVVQPSGEDGKSEEILSMVPPPLKWTVDESTVPQHALDAAAAVVAAAERRANKEQEIKKIVRLTDIAVKHLVERTLEQLGLRGLVALLHHPRHNQDERIMWRAARAIREQLLKGGDTARLICTPIYGGAPVHITGTELTADWKLAIQTDSSAEKTAANDQVDDSNAPLDSDLPAPNAPISSAEVWSVRLLQIFPDCVMLQAQALRILGTLAFQNDLFRRKIGEQHGIFYILESLRRHYRISENIVLYGATALTNLCHASNDNRSRFLEYEGVSLLIEIFRSYLGGVGEEETEIVAPLATASNPTRVLCQCCYVLLTVAGGSDVMLAERIIGEDGDALILRCLQNFQDDAELQQYGLWALYNLAVATPRIADNIVQLGAVEYCKMIIEIYTEAMDKASSGGALAEVVRQAHSTLQVLLKSTVLVPENPTTSISAAAVGGGVGGGNSKRPDAMGKSKSTSKSTNSLILPAINIYSATQTVVSNSSGTKKKNSANNSISTGQNNALLSKSTQF